MNYYYPPFSPPYAPQPAYQPPRMGEMGQGYSQTAQTVPGASQSQIQGQMQPQTQSPMQGFASRPVTSREEAVALQVDFLGPGTLMPDLSHGTIYLKRFNPNTGACDFFTFLLQQPEQEPTVAPAVEYATKEDIRLIREELEGLKRPAKGGRRNETEE